MILIQGGTKISSRQLRLEQIFSVERVLASRGFTVQKEGNGRDTLLDKSSWSRNEADLVFNIFDNTTLRKELLEFIGDKIEENLLSEIVKSLVTTIGFKKDRQRFSTTYEWYVGELLVRRFMAFSSSYGISISDILRNSDEGTSGDFDVLSILGDMSLIYVECKSGKTKQSSIRNTLERSISLHCAASVVIRQDITEQGLKQQLTFNHPIFECPADVLKLNIKNQPDSTIYKWFNCYFVNASESSDNIEKKLKAVLRIIEASKSIINMSLRPSDEQYESIGYEFSKL